MSNAKALMTNSAPIENNELKALRQQLTAQHSAKQIFKRGKLAQLEQNSRSLSQNPSQTNQSVYDNVASRL